MSMKMLSEVLGPFKGTDARLVNANKILSKSTKLLSEQGLVRLYEGKVVLLPFILRAMKKLENIIREGMNKVSAHEMLLPSLVNEKLLIATGRDSREELFKLKDRTDKNFILAPTNEEAITYILSCVSNLKESSIPLRLYQINMKFRDEAHPKHGLIRAKEFVMKDLYCFDVDSEARNKTYNEVKKQYHSIFERLGLPYKCVKSSGSDMLGSESHEFHFLSEIGEDELLLCEKCGHAINVNLSSDNTKCSNCMSNDIKILQGIEVGHTFNIGTSYSEKLKANYVNSEGKMQHLELSSYGIGLTRILGASAEVLSTDTEIRWPLAIAPFSVCIIPPKEGSKEENQHKSEIDNICTSLNESLKGDVVIDDRGKFTIGKKLLLNQKLGFPFIVVIGNEIMKEPPKVEVIDVNLNKKHLISPSDVVGFVLGRLNDKSVA